MEDVLPIDDVAAEAMLDPSGALAPGWRAVAAAALGLATGPSVLLVMCFGVFMPALRGAFGWTVGQISVGAMIISLSIGVVSPLQGVLADRYGSRRLILMSTPLFGAGFAAMALMNGALPVFYVGCAALAVLGLGTWPLSYMRLATTWFDRRLGLALGLVNVGLGIGAALGPIIIAAVMASWGWRGAYLALGLGVIVVAMPMLSAWARERPRASGPRGMPAGFALPQVVRQRSFWLLCIGFGLLGVWSAGLLIHQVNILLDRGLSRGQAVAAQSVLGVASIAGRLVVGWLLDRLSVRLLMMALMLAAAAACGLYAFAAGPILFVGAVLCGVVIGAEFDVCAYAIRRFHGLRSFGATYGIVFTAFQIGGATGSVLMGAIRDHGSYGAGLAVLAAAALACGGTFLSLGRYRFPANAHAAEVAAHAWPADLLPAVPGSIAAPS